MDKDQEIAELKAKLTEAEKAAGEIDALKKSLAEKDLLIKQKTDDIVGIRRKYKRVADMTDEEKEALSEKELELQQRIEEFEKEQADFASRQAEVLQKEVQSRRDGAIRKLVGDNKEVAEKIAANYGRIKDAEGAQTEEEVSKYVHEAFNMLGEARPDPIAIVVNGSDGMTPGGSDARGFADTEAGKSLATALGLPVANKE